MEAIINKNNHEYLFKNKQIDNIDNNINDVIVLLTKFSDTIYFQNSFLFS